MQTLNKILSTIAAVVLSVFLPIIASAESRDDIRHGYDRPHSLNTSEAADRQPSADIDRSAQDDHNM